MFKSKIVLSIATVGVISFLIGVIVGIIIGVRLEKNNADKTATQVVTPATILERISDQSFLVTKSVLSSESVTVTIDQGSSWSNFWWGHTITARGLVQSDIGVDLSKLTEDSIIVDKESETITFYLPAAEIFRTYIVEDIEVKTKSGLLKKLLLNNLLDDYNLATEQLSEKAEESVKQNKKIFEESESSTLQTLEVIFKDTGYTIETSKV